MTLIKLKRGTLLQPVIKDATNPGGWAAGATFVSNNTHDYVLLEDSLALVLPGTYRRIEMYIYDDDFFEDPVVLLGERTVSITNYEFNLAEKIEE